MGIGLGGGEAERLSRAACRLLRRERAASSWRERAEDFSAARPQYDRTSNLGPQSARCSPLCGDASNSAAVALPRQKKERKSASGLVVNKAAAREHDFEHSAVVEHLNIWAIMQRTTNRNASKKQLVT